MTQSRELVIDASVARASGGKEATHPTAGAARDFLLAVLTICHKAVMTPAIRDEWDKHQSNFARKWRRSMMARKKLDLVNLEELEGLRQKIDLIDIPQASRTAMLKDCHLIEAAIATERRIISLDATARELFSVASHNVKEIRDVIWVNPAHDSGRIVAWLNDGAPDQLKWQLGHQ